MPTTSLNAKLHLKASNEVKKLYFKTMQDFVTQFKKTFFLSDDDMKKCPYLNCLRNLQYSNDTTDVLKLITNKYTDNYINNFITKVEEIESMIDDSIHDHTNQSHRN